MSNTRSSVDQSEPEKSSSDTSAANAELASWGTRVAAKLIDSFVVWGLFTVLWVVGMFFVARGNDSLGTLFYTVSWVEGVIGWGTAMWRRGRKRATETALTGAGPAEVPAGPC